MRPPGPRCVAADADVEQRLRVAPRRVVREPRVVRPRHARSVLVVQLAQPESWMPDGYNQILDRRRLALQA